MLRSLYSGISGLRAHQQMMDVTGNNISNVNTTGFRLVPLDGVSVVQTAEGAFYSGPPGYRVRSRPTTSSAITSSAPAVGSSWS